MLRIIVRSIDSGEACNVGGPVHTRLTTFDVDLPEIEKLLIPIYKSYVTTEVIGVEIIKSPTTDAPDLLAACQKLSSLAGEIYVNLTDGENDLLRAAFSEIDAAIAKATGKDITP